jgi:glycosyltransferase involved in cell wall biosynthesis
MGATHVVRDGIEGFVRDPFDADGWVEAIRKLAADDGLRSRMGAAASAAAANFTWKRAGERLREQFLRITKNGDPGRPRGAAPDA